ncbi:MAG: hypothetical protein P8X48_04305 [Acidiferrobacteraceae bacterium]|jgi:polysaccharide chain length determinant protein (PEP-CTERM system associated)
MVHIPIEQVAKIIANEAYLHRKAVVALFALICIAFVSAGLVWPKTYTSYTTIYVEQKNIIEPLMQGTAVATNVQDRARNAREIIYGRDLLTAVLEDTHPGVKNDSPLELEKRIEKLKRHTDVVNVGRNLIKISYSSTDPKEAYRVVKKYADLFMEASVAEQVKESKRAFDFINKQVQQYHQKLTQAEQELKEVRSQNLDAIPGTGTQVGNRITTLQEGIENTREALREAQIKAESLRKQLSGETAVAGVLSRESQYAARISELQTQLDTLRLSYRETYPDIVSIKHQIEDLKKAIIADRKEREHPKAKKGSGTDDVVEQSLIINPLYQKLRREMSDTRTSIDTLRARLKEKERMLSEEINRGKRVHSGEAQLAELTRDYEVNRDIYRDLLRKRENARVSMNMDLGQQGLTLRLYQAAFLPLRPSGLRFVHFVAMGVLLGVGMPFGLLVLKYRFDPRVRTESLLSEELGLPVLSVVPHLGTPSEEAALANEFGRLAFVVMGTLALTVVAGILKLRGIL